MNDGLARKFQRHRGDNRVSFHRVLQTRIHPWRAGQADAYHNGARKMARVLLMSLLGIVALFSLSVHSAADGMSGSRWTTRLRPALHN